MYDSFNVADGGESLGAGRSSQFYIIESLFIDVYVVTELQGPVAVSETGARVVQRFFARSLCALSFDRSALCRSIAQHCRSIAQRSVTRAARAFTTAGSCASGFKRLLSIIMIISLF